MNRKASADIVIRLANIGSSPISLSDHRSSGNSTPSPRSGQPMCHLKLIVPYAFAHKTLTHGSDSAHSIFCYFAEFAALSSRWVPMSEFRVTIVINAASFQPSVPAGRCGKIM